MQITDHAIVRFLQRYEKINLNHAVRNYTDRQIVNHIGKKTGLTREMLQEYIGDICTARNVGKYGPAHYPIGRRCKALFKHGRVITVRPG